MGKRKARIHCRVTGCHTPIIFDRLMCMDCWRLLPLKIRKGHLRRWRELKQYLTRFDNAPNLLGKAEPVAFRLALRYHSRSCDLTISKSSRIRAKLPSSAIMCDIEHDIREMGLL